MDGFYWESDEDPTLGESEPAEEEAAAPASGISSRWLGLIMFMAVEAMLFLILLFSFIYLREQGESWPPAGLPPLDRTWPLIGLMVLLLSGVMAYGAERSVRRYRITVAEKQLLAAAGLGILFLAGQVREFAVLLSNGAAVSSSLYGGIFYLTIGFHGLHVISGIIWLLWVWWLTRDARETPAEHFGVSAAAVYWGFVASVWVLLFVLLYG